jgi:NTP pyrophosphatase (non-canonical NTP hydrolase)
MSQALKTLEEVGELIGSIHKDDKVGVSDDLGDILVTIIIQAEMQGLKLEDCLLSAYNVISKRQGTIINGQFVKE